MSCAQKYILKHISAFNVFFFSICIQQNQLIWHLKNLFSDCREGGVKAYFQTYLWIDSNPQYRDWYEQLGSDGGINYITQYFNQGLYRSTAQQLIMENVVFFQPHSRSHLLNFLSLLHEKYILFLQAFFSLSLLLKQGEGSILVNNHIAVFYAVITKMTFLSPSMWPRAVI